MRGINVVHRERSTKQYVRSICTEYVDHTIRGVASVTCCQKAVRTKKRTTWQRSFPRTGDEKDTVQQDRVKGPAKLKLELRSIKSGRRSVTISSSSRLAAR